jgi:hypothetical protein
VLGLSFGTPSTASPSMASALQSSWPSTLREATYFGIGFRTSVHGPGADRQQAVKPSKPLRPTNIAASSVSNRELAPSWSPTATNQSISDVDDAVDGHGGRVDRPRHRLALSQDVSQFGCKGIRIPSLSVFAAEEAAVVAGKITGSMPSRSATAKAPRFASSPSDSAPAAIVVRPLQ